MQTQSFKTIHEGMKVFDSHSQEIGKVEWVKFSEDDPDTAEVESADIEHTMDRRASLIDNIADAFKPEDLPDEIRERLLQEGFVKVDSSGLFEADRFVLPNQIASISGESIMLNVDKDELIKEP